MNENVDPARVEARPQFPPPSTPSPVSPNDAPPSPPGAPTPPRTRRLAKWLFVLALAIAAFFALVLLKLPPWLVVLACATLTAIATILH